MEAEQKKEPIKEPFMAELLKEDAPSGVVAGDRAQQTNPAPTNQQVDTPRMPAAVLAAVRSETDKSSAFGRHLRAPLCKPPLQPPWQLSVRLILTPA